jgi:crossover junction endodeoxyribonuclease RuvC
MLILGLDPGLRHTGWGLVEAQGNSLRFVACGTVHTDGDTDLASRLGGLYQGLTGVIAGHVPREAAVEETVVNRNPLSSLKLAHARGVVLLAATHAGLVVHEYASKQVKRAVTGTGGAAKEQVAMMVRFLLPGSGEVGADAADALAVAICHAHFRAGRAQITAQLARDAEARR